MFHEGRRNAVVDMVKDLKSKGIRIDGVGLQGHYGLRSDNPPLDELEKSIVAFAEAGVDVHFTELDLDVLPSPDWTIGADVRRSFEYREKMNPYKEGLPDSVQMAQDQRWMELFDMFLKHQDQIKRVTLWGVTDLYSWKNFWPIPRRTNYPLLFDREYQPKPVVEEIIKAAKAS
jgi:endo-1,4-beta-xylanase